MVAVKEALAPVMPIALAKNGKHAPITQAAEVLPYRAVTARELRTMAVPPRQWVVMNIIPRGLLSAIVAQSGTGKTWLMLMLARALATGEKWAEKYLVCQCVVGILDLEGDYTGLQERWLALECGHGQLSDEAAEHVFFLSDIGGLNVLDKDTAAKIKASICAHGIEVLMVDTLSRTHSLDENSADMRLVMIELERVARDTGCTVILAHHAGKDGGRGGRGSSTIKDALQHELSMTAIERDGEVTGVKIALTKAKSGPLISHMATMHIEELAAYAGVKIVFDDELPKMGRPSKDDEILVSLQKRLGNGRTATRSELVNHLIVNDVCKARKAESYLTQALDDGTLTKDARGQIKLADEVQK